jgi:hypothetical protein
MEIPFGLVRKVRGQHSLEFLAQLRTRAQADHSLESSPIQQPEVFLGID